MREINNSIILAKIKAVTYLIKTSTQAVSFSAWKFPRISETVKREAADGVAVKINSTFSY